MNNIFVFISTSFTFFFTFNSFAETQWGQLTLGDQSFSYPSIIIGQLHPNKEIDHKICQDLQKDLIDLNPLKKNCDEGKASACLMLKKHLRQLAQNRFEPTGVLNPQITQFWTILQDEQIPKEFLPNLSQDPWTIEYSSGSMMTEYSKYSTFDSSDTLDWTSEGLRGQNRFLHCDLADGMAKVFIKYQRTLKVSMEETPEIIDFTWKTYLLVKKSISEMDQEMPQLVKAAILGQLIGLELLKTKLDVKKLNLTTLFMKFFSFNQNELVLKEFRSKIKLKEELFPPVTLQQNVDVIWSH